MRVICSHSEILTDYYSETSPPAAIHEHHSAREGMGDATQDLLSKLSLKIYKSFYGGKNENSIFNILINAH